MRDLPQEAASDAAASELAELRQQVAELRQAVRARDDFIAIAAHELRNAMTPIMAAAELALKAARDSERICPPRVTTLLERVQLLARNVIQRSTRLLDIGQIEAGNLRLEPSRTDLSAVVLSVARRPRPLAGAAGSSSKCSLGSSRSQIGSQWSKWSKTCSPTRSSSAWASP